MFRLILAVIAGLVVGSLVNMALVMLSGHVIPPPAGVDTATTEGLKAAMPLFEPKHFLFPFLAHAVGTLVGAFGLNQELLAQRVQADGNGDFSFSFTSQIPLPGTRYEVTMNAERGGMAPTETQLVLFQK